MLFVWLTGGFVACKGVVVVALWETFALSLNKTGDDQQNVGLTSCKSDTQGKEKKEAYQCGTCVLVVQYQGQAGWHPLENLQYTAGH